MRSSKSGASSDDCHSHVAALTFTIEDAVRDADHQRKALEERIVGRYLADAHEEVLEALNVNSHQLGDEFSDLLILFLKLDQFALPVEWALTKVPAL